MKTKKIIYGLFLIFFQQSCETKVDQIFFRLSEDVTCERIDTVDIGVPLNISIYKDDLFIADSRSPMIVHYNMQTRETDRFLTSGRGPGETLPPVVPFANPFNDGNLYIFSKQAMTMGLYPLNSCSLFVPIFQLRLPVGCFNLIPYEKDRYLGVFVDTFHYKVLNEEGTVLNSFGDYPDFLYGEDLIPYRAKALFHQIDFANSFRSKKLVAASTHVIDIIDYSNDIENGSIKRVLLAPYDYEYESTRGTWAQAKKGVVIGSRSVTCDDKYIYLLFNPGIEGEENKGVNKEIWVLDWDGKPVKKLILDANVIEITADPFSDDHTIYGLAYENDGNDEHYQIVKIKVIPGIH